MKVTQDRRCYLVVLVADEGLHHGHPVGGEGARLVRADGGGVTHGLARVKVPHQVVVAHHFLCKSIIANFSNADLSDKGVHRQWIGLILQCRFSVKEQKESCEGLFCWVGLTKVHSELNRLRQGRLPTLTE